MSRYRIDYDPTQINYNGLGDDLPGKAYMYDMTLNRRLTDREVATLKAAAIRNAIAIGANTQ